MKIWIRKDTEQTLFRSKNSLVQHQLAGMYNGMELSDYYRELSRLFGELLDVDEKRLRKNRFYIPGKDFAIPTWFVDDVINDKRNMKGVSTNMKYSICFKHELFTTYGKVVAHSNAENYIRNWIRDLSPQRIYVYNRLDDSARLRICFLNEHRIDLIGETNFDRFNDLISWLGGIRDTRIKKIPLIIESTSKRMIEDLCMGCDRNVKCS